MTEQTLKELATDAVKEISTCLIDMFASPPDVSYKRAMFRQTGEYGCSLIINVELENTTDKARITMKFGKVS